MTEFLRGLAGVRAGNEERERSRPQPSSRDLAGDELLGAKFREGDRVVDPVTGQEGTVERVTFRHVLIPTPGR
jgi:hypothetical protein